MKRSKRPPLMSTRMAEAAHCSPAVWVLDTVDKNKIFENFSRLLRFPSLLAPFGGRQVGGSRKNLNGG